MDKDELFFKRAVDFFDGESYNLTYNDQNMAIGHVQMSSFSRLTYWERVRDHFNFMEIEPKQYLEYSPLISPSSSFSSPHSRFYQKTAHIEINSDYKEKLLENFHYFSFSYFYPHLIIALTQQEMIPYDRDIEILKHFLAYKDDIKSVISPRGYRVLQSWICYYFGIKMKDDFLRHAVTDNAIVLLEKIYDDEGPIDQEHFIYADIDCVYFFSDDFNKTKARIDGFMKSLGFPYKFENYEVGVIAGNKKYIIVRDDKKVYTSGFRRPKLF